MLNESDVLASSFFADSVSLVRFQRFLCAQSMVLPGQNENLWELVYVEQGALTISVKSCSFTLSRNNVFLRAQGRSSVSYSAPGREIPCALLFTFSCASPYLYLLSDQTLTATMVDRLFLARLLIGAASDAPRQSFQMERLLDRLFIRCCLPVLPFVSTAKTPGLPCPLSGADIQYLSILRYLKTHLRARLSIERICRDNLISRSQLEQLFHKRGWHGVIDCFSHMKIDAAKRLITNGSMTFSQISATLGYSSSHYFSRQFKKETNMTPTEYALFAKEHSGDVIPSLSHYFSIASR